jgi:ankyrin repeat protein
MYTLTATLLCTAAFAGQTKVVETLLALGAEVNEQQMGMPGMLCWGEDMLPVTPLMAAIARGHWDAARRLMDHGAVCDLHGTAMEKLWNRFQTEDLYHGVQVGLVRNSCGQKGVASLTA